MGTAKLDLAKPPTFSHGERALLDAMPADDIERNARDDADNLPLTDGELDRLRSAATVRSIRKGRGMTQTAFADTYGIAVTRLRDWEQGRFRPDAMARTYLELIRQAPLLVEQARASLQPESP